MLKEKVGGTIINIASDLSLSHQTNLCKLKITKITKPVTYSVIKHGIVGLIIPCFILG